MHLPTLRVVACTGLLAVAVSAQAQDRRPGPAKSVEVGADKSVTFQILAPKAESVTVGGDFGRGEMKKDDHGVWAVTVGPLTPDFYSYSFTIDGVKVVDSRNPLFKPGIAGLDSMFEVPGPEADFEATKDV